MMETALANQIRKQFCFSCEYTHSLLFQKSDVEFQQQEVSLRKTFSSFRVFYSYRTYTACLFKLSTDSLHLRTTDSLLKMFTDRGSLKRTQQSRDTQVSN